VKPTTETDRQKARQERKARSQQQYELLEQARRERHSNVRRAISDAARLRPGSRASGEPRASESSRVGGEPHDPGRPRGLPSRRTLIVLLIVIVAAGFIISRGGTSSSSPALATSCTTPAVAAGDVNGSNSLRYSITGPAAGTYVIAIDAATATVHGDGVDLTPKSSTAVAIKKGLKDCKGDGALPSTEGAGHQLVIFRDGKNVARTQLPG
jgi:hypothetical protein